MLIEHQTISEYFFGNTFFAEDLFRDLSPETQRHLNSIKQTKNFAKNEIVFADEELPSAIYFLIKGKAQISENNRLTEKNLVRSIKSNEILGLTEAITNLSYKTSVKTVSPCHFEYIRCEDLIRFLQNEPEVCFRLLQILGANFQKIYQLFARQ